MTLETIPAEAARRLLMDGQGLLDAPGRRAGPAAVRRIVEKLGFVQVDTINIAIRAHHHILLTRLDGYQPRMLERLLERDRSLFEHWTHDASVIPTVWYGQWKRRFARYRRNALKPGTWWHRRMEGRPHAVVRRIRERVRADGPLMSRHFEHVRRPGESNSEQKGWWSWKPSKAALEYLWRVGELSIDGRENFHKRYDLTERVLGESCLTPMPTPATHRAWAGAAALERLAIATPSEIAAYFAAIPLSEARTWCDRAVKAGEAVDVQVEAADGSGLHRAVAVPDWKRRAARLADPPRGLRLLSPFDPLVRDRKRLQRRFGFEYRFEAFVPAAKRRYGYYVLPILEQDRLVGRLDPKVDRDAGVLEVRGLWWEDGVRPTAARRRALAETLERYAAAAGVTRVRM
ncbi:MAG: winged helix-turn-helix domain-containing protein [Phycisphaerales bacterium]|nr:winged helix-turn-helix domain-containing protein [Phycisphaerales bacterium]